MSIFAIADLHLSFGENKPMDIFGTNWEGHFNKIKEDWEKNVTNADTVLIPGDFSWATYLEDTYEDFKYLNDLPGKKLLLKGNHDYWWTTLTAMRKYLKDNNFTNIDFLHNNSYLEDEHIITGCRGWTTLESEENKKVLKRENLRLELSLQDGINKFGSIYPVIVVMHYPPFNDIGKDYDFVETMKKYNVKQCVYGHLHGPSHREAIEGNIQNIDFRLVSCDYTNFKLIKLT